MTERKSPGRPKIYEKKEHQVRFQKLVYLKRKESPSGQLKISDMVRFSEQMNQENLEEFPIAYNKDAWSVYGRIYIEQANQISLTKIKSGKGKKLSEVPNFSQIIEIHGHNKNKLIEYFLPIENLLHQQLDENNELVEEIGELKNKIYELENKVLRYEAMTLEMAHHSKIKKYRDKYRLADQISFSKNKEVLNQMDRLNDFLEPKKVSNAESPSTSEESIVEDNNPFFTKWKEKREKK